MKKTITVTLAVAILLIGLFWLAPKSGLIDTSKTLKIGFLYIGDGASAYTRNFMNCQKKLEEIYGSQIECIARYNIPDGEEKTYIQELIDEGCGMIFGTSYGYQDEMKEAAAANPGVEFCQATGTNVQDVPVCANYHTWMGRISEGRYVSGVVAGMKLNELIAQGKIADNEALIGYVAAYPYSEVISGYTAFFLGVRSVCKTAEMKVRYTNTWGDIDVERRCALQLIDENCVIISQHSDTSGPAVACENADAEHPVYLVSYNQSMIDAAPTSALTGCRINWAPYEIAAVGAILKGESIEKALNGKAKINGQDAGAGFSEGWVEMLDMNRIAVAEGTEEAVSSTIEALCSGKLTIFRGNYTGTDPYNPSDVINLSKGYPENAFSSAPSFHYVLDDVIHVEE